MEKTDVNNHTSLVIFFLATAVVVTGGLAVIVSQQAAFATTGVGLVTICHIPPGNPDNRHEITVGVPAVAAHVREHGDYIGPCQPNPDPN